MFIPKNVEKCVALIFGIMIFTGDEIKNKIKNSSELIIFRIQSSSVFSM